MREIENAILKLKIFFANSDMSFYAQPMLLAIDALEKQVPKKMVNNSTQNICSRCNKKLPNIEFEDLTYCPHCGQKLDWSESDE